MNLKTCIVLSLASACLALAGCKTEPELRGGNKAAASETAAESPAQKTVVRSIKTGSAPNRTAATVAPAPGTTRTARDSASTTEPTVFAYGTVTHPGGEPAAGITIAAHSYSMTALRQGRVEESDVHTTAITDAKGHYELTAPNVMGIHLRLTGEIPPLQVTFDHQSLYENGKPKRGLTKIHKDVTLIPGHPLTGSVVDEKGQPMPGLPVHLIPKRGEKEERLVKSTETTTTAAGTFDLTQVATGKWLIGTVHPDYAAISEEISVPTSGPVTLQLGLRGGTISGHVFHKNTGQGASGLTVKMLRSDAFGVASLENSDVRTAADGAFQFDHVTSGPKRLMIDTGGNDKLGMALPLPSPVMVGEKETTEVALFVYPGHTITGRVYDKDTQEALPGAKVYLGVMSQDKNPESTSDAEGNYRLDHIFSQWGNRVALQADLEGFQAYSESSNESSIQISLTEDAEELSKDLPMVKTIKVSGRVVTKDEVPVPHAEVALFDSKSYSRTDEKATVNPDGTFELECSPFVSIVIEATAAGYGRVVSDKIEVATKDIEGVKLVMDVGALVQGRVLDPDGKPLSGVKVVEHREFRVYTSYEEVAVSGEDGVYQVRDAAKRLLIKAKQEGYADSEVLELAITPGETKEDADLLLRKGFSIAGRVVTSSGRPISSSHVSINSADSIHASDRTESSGEFELKDLPEGVYRVYASAGSGSKEVQGVKSGTKNLEIVIGDPEIKDGVKFIGTVVDDLTGDPIREFTIEPIHNLKINKLSEPGKFELLGVQVRWGYHAIISSEGYMKQTFDTESSSAGEDIEQTFRLGKGGAIIGRVIQRGTSKPLPDVSVINWGTAESWERERKGPQNHTSTDAEGKFTLAPAPSGKNYVQIKPSAPNVEAAHNIEVKSEQVADLGDIEVGAGGTIRGVVLRGANEDPVPDQKVSISAYSQDLQVSRNTSTNEQGQFEFTELPPVEYTVTASSTKRGVKVTADNTVDVKLVLGGVLIRGTVYRGNTPQRASISGTGPDGQRISTFSESGDYKLEDVVPGTYKFSLHPQTSADTLEETVEIPDQPEFVKDFRFPDCSLTVLVVDSAGQPVPRASVAIARSGDAPGPNQGWQGQRKQTSYSDTEGRAKFEMLKPGTYSITGQKDEVGAGVLSAIRIADGDHNEVRLELNTGGGTLESVALSYATGQGVPEAWCYLYGENGQFGHAAKRDAAGLMVIKNIPPGTYRTNVSYWSHSMSEKQIEIKAGETARIEDVLYPAGVIRWQLMKADGSGAGGADVTVTPVAADPPEQPKSGKTGAGGLFLLRGLAPGTYQATAQLSGKPAITESFTVTAGAEAKKETTVPGW